MKRSAPGTIVCALLALAPTMAHAHLAATGMGPLYDGIAHFALSPEGFLPLLALAFFAGLRDSKHARSVFYALPLAWFVGGVLAIQNIIPSALVVSLLSAALFLISGGLLAANSKLPVPLCVALAVALGLVRGLADFTDVDAQGSPYLVLFGVCASVAVASALATSVTLSFKRLWMIVVARVYGSWIAALGLLLAGWIYRYGAIVR